MKMVNIPYLEINEVVLIHFNIVDNEKQQDSSILHTFVPNKLFVQLLYISLKDFVFLKSFDSEFSYTEVWFTNQNS